MQINRTACTLAAVFALAFLFTTSAVAQEDDAGPITQGDDARYLSVQYVKYKPGRREEAMQIITDYFGPAAAKAGLAGPMLAIHFQTGEWDAAFLWPLKDGMADLEWYRSPDSVKWFEALAELNGGVEEAGKIIDRYQDTVREMQSEVGHHHVPAED
jgi:hypothetical protein